MMKFYLAVLATLCLLSVPMQAQYWVPVDTAYATNTLLYDEYEYFPPEYRVKGDSLFKKVGEHYYDTMPPQVEHEWRYVGKIIFAPDSMNIIRTSGTETTSKEWWR